MSLVIIDRLAIDRWEYLCFLYGHKHQYVHTYGDCLLDDNVYISTDL